VEPQLKQKAQKKPKGKKEKKEIARKRAGESDVLNPNLIKVKNKLVGNLEQGDLYASDDGNNKVEIVDEIIDDKLDLGNSCAAPKIT
jgi:predicted membrane protein